MHRPDLHFWHLFSAHCNCEWRGFFAASSIGVADRQRQTQHWQHFSSSCQFYLFLCDECYQGNQCGYPGDGYYRCVNQMEKYTFGFRQTFTIKLQELVSASRVTVLCHLFSWMSMSAAWKLSRRRVSRTGEVSIPSTGWNWAWVSILARCLS